MYSLSLGSYSSHNALLTNVSELPLTDKIFIIQSDTIKALASTSCVIVGRCAENVLSKDDSLLSVFIHADFNSRVERIMDLKKMKKDQATSLIKKMDKKRASYHNYYCDTRWGEASTYDLCINSNCDIEYASNLIIAAVNAR